MQSHLIFSTVPSCFLLSEIFAISAEFTFLYPCAATTTYENLILIPRFIASLIISDCGLTLESKMIGLIPFFLNSIAVSYPLSLFVKTNGFLPLIHHILLNILLLLRTTLHREYHYCQKPMAFQLILKKLKPLLP